jgi:uncharacterized protein (DUF1810 family)
MTGSGDPHNLERFVEAQAEEPSIETVKSELRSGRKQSHWMWYVFPQIEGLGRSRTARRYAISGRTEARAYLRHPVLGPRLRECTEIVNGLTGRSATEIFGSPDDLKFCSSMTLFEEAAEEAAPFSTALERYYDGERDTNTFELLD